LKAPQNRRKETPMSMTRLLPSFALAAMLVTGCSIFNRDTPATASFMLDAPPQQKAQGASLGSVMIRSLAAVEPYDSRAFVYKMAGGEWRYDSYNGFLCAPSDMMTEAVARAFQASGRFDLVATPSVATVTEFATEIVVEEMYSDFSDTANPKAIVKLRMYLLERASGRSGVVGQSVGGASVAIKETSPKAVADALSAAAGQAIGQLVAALPAEKPTAVPPKQ
jgi:ABC-type uncharacterized transport system auxiliary subunit